MANSPTPIQAADKGNGAYTALICMIAALGGLLFGYDTAVISGAVGFLKKHFELTAAMEGWAASSALLGCVVGVAFAGVFNDRFGRKKALVVSGVLFLISAIGTAVPNTFGLFVAFRIVGGIGVGIASMSSPIYIAEITPARIRGRMVSVNQFAIVTGMLIIYFVNFYIARQGNTQWNEAIGWRWMFASGVLPSALFLVCLLFVPESPRWLFEKGDRATAERVLTRVGGKAFAETELRAIEESLRFEVVSLRQLLMSKALRTVLLIGIGLAVLQQVTGINVFLYYAPEIFKKLGSGSDTALLQTIVVGGVNLLFTIIAIWTVDRWGRKPLMIIGSIGMGLSLVALGLCAQLHMVSAWMLVFILGYIGCFALSVGPVTWVLLSELFPTRVRGRALSVATFCLWIANFIISQTFPMMDENEWLIQKFNHGFPFYVYAFFCVVLLALVAAVPETKGRTLEEIERFWDGKITRSRRDPVGKPN